jgi:hypothetical protein
MVDVPLDQTVAIRIAKSQAIMRSNAKICPRCESVISARKYDHHTRTCVGSRPSPPKRELENWNLIKKRFADAGGPRKEEWRRRIEVECAKISRLLPGRRKRFADQLSRSWMNLQKSRLFHPQELAYIRLENKVAIALRKIGKSA